MEGRGFYNLFFGITPRDWRIHGRRNVLRVLEQNIDNIGRNIINEHLRQHPETRVVFVNVIFTESEPLLSSTMYRRFHAELPRRSHSIKILVEIYPVVDIYPFFLRELEKMRSPFRFLTSVYRGDTPGIAIGLQ